MDNLKWWQQAVFYQIYPHSFADSNGDGISDFPGMTARLDYLQDLGVDALWLSPHFPSPFYDCGYDVSDYTDVGPEYGTLADFKRFLDEAHRRDLRVILDMVLNHTSDQHRWFQESRSSREHPKRDWYIWRDGKNGGPPNNWDSSFGGSAWEYDETAGQYYYHFFFKQQPDLNWRNPAVKQAMWDAIRFWLDMGVDGYRLDAISTIYENPDLPDHTGPSLLELQQAGINAKTPEEYEKLEAGWKNLFQYQVDLPEVHSLMKELRRVIDSYPDRVLVGETDDIRFYGSGDDELHLNFNFPLMQSSGPLTPAWIRKNQQQRLGSLPPGAWPCNTLGNHDSPRVYSRYGEGQGENGATVPHPHDAARARLSLALMLTLRGTPFLYNGEEIGMTDYYLSDPALFRDNNSKYAYPLLIQVVGKTPEEALKIAALYGRDKCRTPMQWSNAPNAGFCPPEVTPWLPVNPNYAEGVNVADQQEDPGSLLNFYKHMLRLRRSVPGLIDGDYTALNEDAKGYLAFLRSSPGGEKVCLVILSYSEQPQEAAFELPRKQARLLFSSAARGQPALLLSKLILEPYEILIAELA
jgi:alpha-glucosidase